MVGLVEAFTGGSRIAWLRNLAIWAAIPAGAAIGAAVYTAIGMRSLWFGAAAAVVAALIATFRRAGVG